MDRGATELDATLVAEVGALVFHVALDRWSAEPGPLSMTDTVADVLRLISVSSGLPVAPRSCQPDEGPPDPGFG